MIMISDKPNDEILSSNSNIDIPISQRAVLSVREASVYARISRETLRELLRKPDCPFAIQIGKRMLVKRRQFDEFLDNTNKI